MKNVIVLLVCFSLLTITSAYATAVNRDQANQYFATCIARTASGINKESMRALCACTSARVMTHLTAEDLEALQTNKTGSQAATHKMLLDVYAPCTEIVASEMINFECVNNDKLYELNKGFDIPKVCACSAQKTADWYMGKSHDLMADILKENPDIKDPAAALLSHPLMKNQSLNNMVACSAVPPATSEPAPAPAQ